MVMRCQVCNKLLAELAADGTIIKCPRCKHVNKYIRKIYEAQSITT